MSESTIPNTQQDWHSWFEEQKRQNLSQAEIEKQLALTFCKDHGIAEVEVRFDGCGDSGQVEDITARDAEEDIVDLESRRITRPISTRVFKNDKWETVTEMKETPVTDLFESWAYYILEAKHPGWEINEGAFGVIKLNAETGQGFMEYNQRVETYETSEDTF